VEDGQRRGQRAERGAEPVDEVLDAEFRRLAAGA
jgi:hypothetical protein